MSLIIFSPYTHCKYRWIRTIVLSYQRFCCISVDVCLPEVCCFLNNFLVLIFSFSCVCDVANNTRRRKNATTELKELLLVSYIYYVWAYWRYLAKLDFIQWPGKDISIVTTISTQTEEATRAGHYGLRPKFLVL